MINGYIIFEISQILYVIESANELLSGHKSGNKTSQKIKKNNYKLYQSEMYVKRSTTFK